MLAVGWVNSQIVFDGIIQGLAIAVIAVGVVLIYRATRIINFAVGNMGVVGAVLLSLLVLQYGVPFWIALAIALVVGLVFGAAVEMTVIRRLKNAPRVVVLVSTIGIAGLAQAIAIEIPQPSDASAHFPSAINGSWTLAGVSIRGADLGVLILVPVSVHPSHLVPRPHHDRQDRQGVRHEPIAGPALIHLSQARLHHGLGARRRALHALGHPHRRRIVDRGGPGHSGSADPLGGPGGGGHRRDALVPRRGHRRGRDRCAPERAHLQLPGRARDHRPVALHRRLHRRDLRQARAGRGAGVRLQPEGQPHSRALALVLVGTEHRQGRHPAARPPGRPSAHPGERAVPPAALHGRPGLCHLCLVADGPDRLARSALVGSDGVRRTGRIVRCSPGHRRGAVLAGHRDHDRGVRLACTGDRHRFPARPRPLPGRRDVRVRTDRAAVLLFPSLLLRGLARWRQRPLLLRDTCGSCPSPGSAPTTTWYWSSSVWSCSS